MKTGMGILLAAMVLLAGCAGFGVSGMAEYPVPWRWAFEPTECQGMALDARAAVAAAGYRTVIVYYRLPDAGPGHVQAAVEVLPGLIRPVTHDGYAATFWTGPTRHMGAREYGTGRGRLCRNCWDYNPDWIVGAWDPGTRLVTALPEGMRVER